MKKNIIMLMGMLILSGFTKKTDGLVYEREASVPFSGLAVKKGENEQILTSWNYKDGKEDGICRNYN